MLHGAFDTSWDLTHASYQWGTYPDDHVIEFIDKYYKNAPDPAAVRFLDLGCGSGAQTFFIAEGGFTVDGMDASQFAILRCLWRKRGFLLGAEDGRQIARRL